MSQTRPSSNNLSPSPVPTALPGATAVSRETARPAMETSRRALQKVGVRRCAGRPLGRVIYDRAKGSENGRGTFVPLHGLGASGR